MTGSGFTACTQPRRLSFLTPELNSSASQQKHSADVGSKTGTSNWAKTGATIWQTDHLMTCSLFHTFVHVSDHIPNWRTICQQWKYEYNTVKKNIPYSYTNSCQEDLIGHTVELWQPVFCPAECNFLKLSRKALTAFYVAEMLDAQSIFVCQGWQSLKLTFRFPLSVWDEAKLGSRFPLSSMIYWQKSWFFTISHPRSLSGCCGKGEMTSSAIFHFKLYVLSSILYNLKPICCILTVGFSI